MNANEYVFLRSTVRESKITSSARQQCGVTGEQLWLKINEPTEKDKGKYTMDIFDGKDGVKRVFDLSGQGEWDPAISHSKCHFGL